jgi:hypothetical protein
MTSCSQQADKTESSPREYFLATRCVLTQPLVILIYFCKLREESHARHRSYCVIRIISLLLLGMYAQS